MRGRPAIPVAERFWSKVDKSGECWIWTAALDKQTGYGRVLVDGRTGHAHRVAYELTVGPIPLGRYIDHVCRVHSCVNPAHLRAVTNKQNSEHRAPSSSNASGVRGVYWHSPTKKWVARVKHNGHVYYGGYFDAIAEAEEAVIAKRNELFTHNDLDRKTA